MAVIFVFRAGNIFWGLISAAILLGSVLLHELGHTAVALSYGCRVRDITLLMLGGRATLIDMPRGPWREALMAAAGPFVSFLLCVGGVMGILGLLGLDSLADFIRGFLGQPVSEQHTAVSPLAYALCLYVVKVNRMLLLFNLVPAFPMDGGRIFRALLESRFGRVKATRIAFRVARVLAVGMALWAVFHGFDFILLLIAYFIFVSSKAEYEMVRAESRYGGYGGYGAPGDDSVVISPPPYGKRDEGTDIFRER
jgi:Zn-dependent protease